MNDTISTQEKRQGLVKISTSRLFLLLAVFVILGGIGSFFLLSGSRADRVETKKEIASNPITEVTALGRLEPHGEVINISAPTYLEGARVAKLLVEETDYVQKGQVIAILDRRDRLEAAVDQAKQQVKVALAKLAQVKAGAKRGEINAQKATVNRIKDQLRHDFVAKQAEVNRLKAEVENARLEYNRYELLAQQGAVSASLRDSKRLVLDTTEEQLRTAEANLRESSTTLFQQVNEARANLNRIAEVRPTDVEEARAEVDSAIASEKKARMDLETAYVRSPLDGEILKIHARPGETIGDTGVAEIGNTRQMDAVAEVYESDLAKVKLGKSAIITGANQAFPEKLHGVVFRITPLIGKKDVLNTDPAASIDARIADVYAVRFPNSFI